MHNEYGHQKPKSFVYSIIHKITHLLIIFNHLSSNLKIATPSKTSPPSKYFLLLLSLKVKK